MTTLKQLVEVLRWSERVARSYGCWDVARDARRARLDVSRGDLSLPWRGKDGTLEQPVTDFPDVGIPIDDDGNDYELDFPVKVSGGKPNG